MKKYLVTLGLVGVAAITLAGCGSSSSKDDDSSKESGKLAADQIFNTTVTQEMPSADLSVATDTISFTALNQVYEGVYRLDKNNEPQPAGAAEKAKVSDDNTIYTIKLREDAKWSNGEPVTAKDYVYSWQRTIDPATASEYAYLFAPVKNAAEISEGKKDKSELGIKAVSDYELEITLEQATPYFDYLLAFPSFFPLNEKEVTTQGKEFASKSDKAIYNGPFTLEDFDGPGIDTEWKYKKNEKYWDAENVKLETINVNVIKDTSTGLNLFDAKKADDVIVSGEQAQQMSSDPAFFSAKESRTSYMEMNQATGKNADAWKNVNLRQAFSAAIDRKSLVNNVLGDGSVVSTGIIPIDMSKDPKTKEDFAKEVGNQNPSDAKKAKEYWEKAKKELGISTLEIDIIASDDDTTKKVLEKIQGDVEKNLSGVKVKLSPVPFSVRLSRSNSGDFDVVLGGWGADYADPSSFTDLFTTGNSYNRGKYSSEKYDALVKSSNTTNAGDPEKRWADLKDATDVLVKEDMGTIPVFQKAEGHLINTKVKDVVHHGAGASWDYKWAYVTE
ncbi:MAG: peptide ABC transporter substrate-binding protein [Lactobacillales bacterium]|jgi:oligopeptide transport system substrate-binding protein|nr:peptide ABC transporter substrate-binding protein [Lactobacillales bacterium]